MVNYFGEGGKAIRLECPHCKKIDSHHVVSTDGSFYHYDDDHVDFFTSIAGSDISYRKRIRLCRNCNQNFNTVEMSDHFLKALVRHADSQAYQNIILESRIEQLVTSLRELRDSHRQMLPAFEEVEKIVKKYDRTK